MKVTKAQAQANRAHVVETASTLFRERGFDGVGVADLMSAAGFTHGGFYKHFRSKADLMAESAACGMAQTVALSAGVDAAEFVRQYLAREHRDVYRLIDEAAESHEPILISGKRKSAVLLSAEDWKAIQETLYLLSVPGMRESIKKGMTEPLKKSAKVPGW